MPEWSIDQEIDANYDYFRRHLVDFIDQERGRIATLHARQVVGFFDSLNEAEAVARRDFPDGFYSLQPVVSEPVDLGFFSHAGG